LEGHVLACNIDGSGVSDRPMFPIVQQLASLMTAQGGAQGPAGCAESGLFLPVVMIAILYFVWILPTQRERKKHQGVLDTLKRGDEVLTSAGLFGTITDMTDKVFTIEIAKNVKVRVLKSSVARKIDDADTAAKSDEAKNGSKDPKASK
jgi:preprotein translocase subunit YajC